MVDEHLGARVGEHRRADGKGLEGQQRQAFVRRWHHDHGCRLQRVEAFLVGQEPGKTDARIVGQRHELHAHQHQRRVAAIVQEVLEVLEQFLAALARIDAAAVEQKRAVHAMAPAEVVRRAFEVRRERFARGLRCHHGRRAGVFVVHAVSGLRQFDATADDVFDERAETELRVDHAAFRIGVPDDAGRTGEDAFVDLETDRRLVVRRRDEQALGRRDLHPEHGRGVEIREEDQYVVVLVVALEVLDEAGCPGALLFQPLEFVLRRVAILEDPVGIGVELFEVARARAGKPAHGDAANAIGALGILVLPADVVARTRREHFHLMPRCQALGDQPAVVLRAAENLCAVPLNDKGDFHKSIRRRALTRPRPAPSAPGFPGAPG